MITTIKQARAVQERRVVAGKFGYAKAVRRFVRREVLNSYDSSLVEHYYRVRNSLPAQWCELKDAA